MTDPISVWAKDPNPASVGGRGQPPNWSINVFWDGSNVDANQVSIERHDVSLHPPSTLTVLIPTALQNVSNPWMDSDSYLNCHHKYYYTVKLWNGSMVGSGQSDQKNQGDISPPHCSPHSSAAFSQNISGDFELEVPLGDVINDYTHEDGSILKGLWQHVHTLQLPNVLTQAISVSLIQTTSGKLEVIARVRPPQQQGQGVDYLVAYERNDPMSEWPKPTPIMADNGPINRVTGTSAFIQSQQDSLVLLVPRGTLIDHYEQKSALEGGWVHLHTLKAPEGTAQVTGVALTQTTEGTLLAIARVTPVQGSDYLVAYEHKPAIYPLDETVSVSVWQGPMKLVANDGPIDQVTGSPSFIQNRQEILELLVPRGTVIDHYNHEARTILEGPWMHVHTLKSPDSNTQITANWLIQSRSGTLEAVARVSPPAGSDYVVGYESIPGDEWQGPIPLVANDGPIVIGTPAPPYK